MTWLVLLLVRRGLSERAAGVLAWVLPALLVVVVTLCLWFTVARSIAHGKDAAVTSYQKDVTIEAANRVIAAERAATANQMTNDAAFDNAQEELHDDVLKNGTTVPVGPGVRSVLDRMRAQQHAGRR